MRKAIRLKLILEIQAEDSPAHDFAQSTTQAVRDILAAGHWRHPTLALTVKDIVEDEDYDSDDKNAKDAKNGTNDKDEQKPAAPAGPATPATP